MDGGGSGAASRPAPSLIAAVAILSSRNAPIYFKSFGAGGTGEEFVKLNLIVYSSLDCISEKIVESRTPDGLLPQPPAAPSAPQSKMAVAQALGVASDGFLGLLTTTEEFKVFGYITNANTKLLLVVRDVLCREEKVRDFFRNFHRLYVDAVSGPFTPLMLGSSSDSRLHSPALEEAVYRLAESAAVEIEYKGPMPF